MEFALFPLWFYKFNLSSNCDTLVYEHLCLRTTKLRSKFARFASKILVHEHVGTSVWSTRDLETREMVHIHHAQSINAGKTSCHNGDALHHVGATCCLSHLLEYRQAWPLEPVQGRSDGDVTSYGFPYNSRSF